MLDVYKELEPVVYGENALKYLFMEHCSPGQVCFNMHWHERMEIIYVVSGNLELRNAEDNWYLGEGQIAVFAPRQLHGGVAGENGVTYHTLMFDLELFYNASIASEKYLQPLAKGYVGFQKCIEEKDVLRVLQCLVRMVNKEERSHPLIVIGMVYEFIGRIYPYSLNNQLTICSQDKGFGIVVDYVNAHYMEKISAKMLSVWFGYNESYFCREFKKNTGFTFSEYVQVLRMELAQKLLRKTRDEIRVIAWKCGYDDMRYFTRCFRKCCGCSPTEFRLKK